MLCFPLSHGNQSPPSPTSDKAQLEYLQGAAHASFSEVVTGHSVTKNFRTVGTAAINSQKFSCHSQRLEDTQRDWWEGEFRDLLRVDVFHGVI